MISQTQLSTQVPKHNMDVPMVINSCSKMSGELILTTDTRVEGKVFGKVDSDRNIIIGTSGYVKGFLRAKNLVIFGRIEGTIIVSGTTIMHPGSSIFGNLYTNLLEVKEGAILTARINTYVEMKAFDEAQLFLAEEMFRLQYNQIVTSAYSKKENTFDDNFETVENSQNSDILINTEDKKIRSKKKNIYWSKVSTNDTKQYEKTVSLNPSEFNPTSLSDSLLKKPDEPIPSNNNPDKESLILNDSSLDVQEILSPEIKLDQITPSFEEVVLKETLDNAIPEQSGDIILEAQTAEIINEKIVPEEIAEAKPLPLPLTTSIIEQLSEDETFSIAKPSTVTSRNIPPIKSITPPEPYSVDEVKATISISKPVVKSAIFASLLGHSDKEEIISSGCEIKTEMPTTLPTSPTKQKNQSHSIFKMGEISNLFIRNKNSIKNSDDTQNIDLKVILPDKINNRPILNNNSKIKKEVGSNTNDNNSSPSFLSKSIQELQSSDYSKLFS